MKEIFNEFLSSLGFLPLNSENWNKFEIIHIKPNGIEERKRINDYISKSVKSASGIYIYQKLDGEILYIGKGKPLKYRLQSHYRESFEEVSGDTKDKLWHRFFSSYTGRLCVCWKEVNDEDGRIVMERMLTSLYTPIFETFRRSKPL